MGISLRPVATQLHFLCSLSNAERLKIDGGFLGRFCSEPQKDHTLTHKESFQCHYGNKLVSCQEQGWCYQLALVTRRIPVFGDSGLRNSLIHSAGLRLSHEHETTASAVSPRCQICSCRTAATVGGQFLYFFHVHFKLVYRLSKLPHIRGVGPTPLEVFALEFTYLAGTMRSM